MFKLKVFLIFTVFAYFTINSLSFPQNHVLASNFFEDDFEDATVTANKWITVGSPGWNVDSGKYRISLSPGLSNAVPNSLLWDLNWTNISYELDLIGQAGVDKNILVKFVDTSNFLEFHANDRGIILEKGSTITGNQVLDQDTRILQNGINYHFKIEVKNNNHIKVYIDDVLSLEGIENIPLANWKVGLRAGSGGFGSVDVKYDNVVVSELVEATPTPTPSPTPSPSPTPTLKPTATPSTTPVSSSGQFELPFNYVGRLAGKPTNFASNFWEKATAFFDHSFSDTLFLPFTGNSTLTSQGCTVPLTCYNSHNGIDFDDFGTDGFVYSVADGKIVYVSKPEDSCATATSGYGCSIIAKYADNLYGLYAHLDRILVSENQEVTAETRIGIVGKTGSATGTHIHFGVLKPVNDRLTSSNVIFMKNKDWKNILNQASNAGKLPKYKSYCTYRSPIGISFAFQDPSGWFGQHEDPWSLSKPQGGCGTTSPYLWKYNVL